MLNIDTYGRIYLGFVALVIFLWVVLIAWTKDGSHDFLLPIMSCFLFCPVFLFLQLIWRHTRNNEMLLVWGSYLYWAVVVPIIWVGIILVVKYGFGFIAVACCEDSYYLNVLIWGELNEVVFHDLVGLLYFSLFLYISLYLIKSIEKLVKTLWLLRGLAVLSALYLIFNLVLLVAISIEEKT